MKPLSSKLAAVATALAPALVSAGLPRHCFFVTDMHGVSDSKEEVTLFSDLPKLMALYEPGMVLNMVTSFLEEPA